MKRVTITDVARLAGVSPTAVSFAFNNPSQLNPATVSRILNAARELGYAPNPLARTLLSGRVGVLGVLVPQALVAIFANPFFASFLQGVGSVCDDHGLTLLVVPPLDGSLDGAIARAPVDGLIIVGLNEHHHEVAPLLKRRVPFVIVDGDAEVASSVNIDDESGAYAAAAHLLAHGQRDVLILTFETPYTHLDNVYYGVGGRRLRGYRRAFIEYGVAWRDNWLLPSLSTVEGGEQSFNAAWDAGLRPTAVLAVSDAIAIGAIKAAQQRGLRIPQDIEIIGFDDIPLAELIQPALSTVRQPIIEKGRIAAELLIAALEGTSSPERVLLPTELILRGTTR
mgnify:CR=1 FL=1